MKNKHLIAYFIIGTVITILGSLLKIMHFEIGPVTGNVMLFFGMMLQVFTAIVFLTKLLLDKDNQFLNK